MFLVMRVMGKEHIVKELLHLHLILTAEILFLELGLNLQLVAVDPAVMVGEVVVVWLKSLYALAGLAIIVIAPSFILTK